MNNNFFIELIVRLFTKNPKFFKVIQFIALFLAALSAGLQYGVDNHVPLPSSISWLQNSVVWISSIVAAVIAQFPNQDAAERRK
jgi:hypothetical protein